MLDNLKRLVAALEQVVAPEQAKPKIKWVVNNLIDCEGNPQDCPPADVGACCLPGGGLGGNQCVPNMMKDACESQGGTFYPNRSCEDIGGDGCSTGSEVETQAPGDMSVEPTMMTP
jgi:hypothetical protein